MRIPWFSRVGRQHDAEVPAIPAPLLAVLESRVSLRAPATEDLIQAAEHALGRAFSPMLRGMYATFDGFSRADVGSLINLWSLEEILQNTGLSCNMDGEKRFAIGDVIIQSHHVLVNVADGNAPVYLSGIEEPYAANFFEYLELLVQGDFDI